MDYYFFINEVDYLLRFLSLENNNGRFGCFLNSFDSTFYYLLFIYYGSIYCLSFLDYLFISFCDILLGLFNFIYFLYSIYFGDFIYLIGFYYIVVYLGDYILGLVVFAILIGLFVFFLVICFYSFKTIG